MRFEFRAHLTESRDFRPIGESWLRWKKTAPIGIYMFSPRKEGRPRKLNQNSLHWLRCQRLGEQPEISLSPEGVHEYLMEECGYGVKKELRGRTIFDRESSTQLTVEEFSALMKAQDILASFVNENREPHHYLILATIENGVRIGG